MNKYDKYLQRIRNLLENLNALRNHDTMNNRLENFEIEMKEMSDAVANQIDEQMARDIHNYNMSKRRKAS